MPRSRNYSDFLDEDLVEATSHYLLREVLRFPSDNTESWLASVSVYSSNDHINNLNASKFLHQSNDKMQLLMIESSLIQHLPNSSVMDRVMTDIWNNLPVSRNFISCPHFTLQDSKVLFTCGSRLVMFSKVLSTGLDAVKHLYIFII